MENSKSKKDLTEGNIPITLAKLTFPMMLGLLSIILFHLTDTYFVGQLGTRELAAISFTFPVVATVNCVTFGLGEGVLSVLSRTMGQNNPQKAKRIITDALILSLILVSIVTLVGVNTIEPVFSLLGAEKEIMPLIQDYMSIWYYGSVFLIVPVILNNVFFAAGNTVIPSVIMSSAGIMNAILDPIFIFGLLQVPAFGMKGAAIATVVSRMLLLLIAVGIIILKEKMISFDRLKMAEVMDSWKAILHIGIPSIAVGIIFPFTVSIVTALIAIYGPESVAAYGVACRVENFFLIITYSLSSVIAPFAGQNWGANKIDRIKSAVKMSSLFSILWGIGIAIFFALFGKSITSLFTENQEVIDITQVYFYIVPVSYGFQSLLLIASGVFNATGKPYYSVTMNIVRMAVLYVPFAYFLKDIFAVYGIFLASTLSSFIAGTIFYFITLKSLNKHPVLEKEEIP